MRTFIVWMALACAAVACSDGDSTASPPDNASLTETSSAIVRAIYEGDRDRFLSFYAVAERERIWQSASRYVERYPPFGPATVEESAAVPTERGVNVSVRYHTAQGTVCQTFVFFRDSATATPALYPLSPAGEGCIGAWGGSGR